MVKLSVAEMCERNLKKKIKIFKKLKDGPMAKENLKKLRLHEFYDP